MVSGEAEAGKRISSQSTSKRQILEILDCCRAEARPKSPKMLLGQEDETKAAPLDSAEQLSGMIPVTVSHENEANWGDYRNSSVNSECARQPHKHWLESPSWPKRGKRIRPSPPYLYFLLFAVRDYQLTAKFRSFCFRSGNTHGKQNGSHTLSPSRQRQILALSKGQSRKWAPNHRSYRFLLPAVIARRGNPLMGSHWQ